jgi:protein kinase A
MHSKKIAYRNLKPENLLIGADGYLKLTDFIFTKQIENRSYTICGTNEYMAPEVILKKGHHWAVDWWALGILIYEMSCGFDPFYDEDPFIIYSKICKGKVTFPRFIDKDAASIIKHLI